MYDLGWGRETEKDWKKRQSAPGAVLENVEVLAHLSVLSAVCGDRTQREGMGYEMVYWVGGASRW